jgi:2-polyprenyl-6-methoxyphenol hydroxylase-like FAD-dependent oxidoreductase
MRGSAAVVGGGIGGLAVAAALHRAGWRVDLREREPDLSGAGTALGMWPSALAALDRIGIGAAVRRQGVVQEAAEFLRADGTRIGRLDARSLRRRTGDPVHLLSRPALLTLLRAAAPAGSLRFGEPVGDLAGLRREHDVVVAADGVFSGVRATLFGPSTRARPTGVTAWRGWLEGRPVRTMTESWGRGAKFGVTPQEGGRANWYATGIDASAPGPDGHAADLRARFAGWGGPVPGILAALTDESILRHDLYVVPRLPTYARGNVVLIGDAAHAMTPDLGRGACEAIVDAVALADCLAGQPSVERALAAYDSRRRRATQRLASAASAASDLTRWRHGLRARDLLLRAALRLPQPG